MGQWQGPQTQIRCGVRNRTEHVFNGMDARMDENFCNILFVVAGVLYCVNAITIKTNLGITISNRLTINWMMLCDVDKKKLVCWVGGETAISKSSMYIYRCFFTAAHNMKRFCQQHPGYADDSRKNKQLLQPALAPKHVGFAWCHRFRWFH